MASDSQPTKAPTPPAPKQTHLCLREVEWLGFDLDHTIVRYRLPALSELVFNSLGNFLINKKKHDKGLLERGFIPSFPLRGTILDAFKGNFIMLSATGKVLSAFHGTRKMDAAEIKEVYPENLRDLAEKARKNEKTPGFHIFSTFFDMPSAVLVAHYVDMCDEKASTMYALIGKDILAAFDFCFNPENEIEGGYFCEIKAHPDKYLIKCTEGVKSWLQAARKHHVGLFLLTNSLSNYTDFLLNFCYGTEWRDVFDLVIVGGKKPEFFTKTASFHAVSEHLVGEPVGPDALVKGGFVAHGNLRDLTSFLARHGRGAQLDAKAKPKSEANPSEPSGGHVTDNTTITTTTPTVTSSVNTTKKEGEREGEGEKKEVLAEEAVAVPERQTSVVYFGDHVLGDVVAVSSHSSWHAVAILEEMLERENTHLPTNPLLAAADTESRLFFQPTFDRWGHFYHFEPVENENTLFEQMLFDFSSFVVPHLDTLASRSISHSFRVIAPDEPRAGLHYYYQQ